MLTFGILSTYSSYRQRMRRIMSYTPRKNIRITLCLIISYLGCGIVIGQPNIQLVNYVDSLFRQLENVNEKEQAAIYFELLKPVNKVPQKHVEIIDKALEFAANTDNAALEARANLQSSLDLINSGKHTLAMKRLNIAYDYYSDQPTDRLLVTTMILQGYNLHRQNYVTEALKVYLRALPLAKEIKDLKRTNNLYNRIVNIYQAQGDYRKALYYADFIIQNCQTAQPLKCPFYLVVKNTTGQIYLDLNEVDSARQVIDEYFEQVKPIVGSGIFQETYQLMGRVKAFEGDWENAIALTDSALVLNLKYQRTKAAASSYGQLADIYQKMGDTEQVIYNLQQQKELATQHGFPKMKMKALDQLQVIYKANRDYSSAYRYAEEWRIMQDSFTMIEQANIIKRHDELIAQYEQEEQLQLLENERIKQRSRNNWLLLLLAFSLLFLGFAAYFLHSRRRLNNSLRENNSLLNQALEDREILIKEVHHRVKNNLQIITSLLNLQARHVTHPEAKIALEDGRNRIRSIALIHQDLHREMQLTGIQSKKYIENLLRNLQLTFRAKRVELKTAIEDIVINEEMMVLVGLVINEAITNAYKHAFPNGNKGEIALKFISTPTHYNLEITDNGKGFDYKKQRQKEETFGLQLIEDMAVKLKANWQAQSNENGTILSLLIPKADVNQNDSDISKSAEI